jgi:branched-chain amino acid transport system permease protein
VLSMINRYLLKELNGLPDTLGLDFDVTSINFGIFGFLLLVMMVLRPEGLLPSSRRKLELRESEIDETDHIGTESDHQLYEVRQT